MVVPGRADAPTTDPESTSPPSPRGPLAFVRQHPWITAIIGVCTIVGAVAGPFWFDETWPLTRQIAAGAFLGAWIGLITTITKMFD